MAVVLCMACATCGRRYDVRSDEAMYRCLDCDGRLRPAGPVLECKPEAKDFFGESVPDPAKDPADLILQKSQPSVFYVKVPSELLRFNFTNQLSWLDDAIGASF